MVNKYSLDDIDKQIIDLVQRDPMMTHTKIAKKVNRSQPTIGLRIKKLQEVGVLEYQVGTSLKRANKQLARVDIQTKSPEKIEKMIETCPHMIHGYRLTGEKNISVVLMGSSIRELYNIIEVHFRNNPDVSSLNTGFITKFVNDLILPIDVKTGCECDPHLQ